MSSNNHINPMIITARMRSHHVLSVLSKTDSRRAQIAEWQAKVAHYYKKFKYEFSINQMHEARRSYQKAKIFAGYIEGLYTSPEVANALHLKG